MAKPKKAKMIEDIKIIDVARLYQMEKDEAMVKQFKKMSDESLDVSNDTSCASKEDLLKVIYRQSAEIESQYKLIRLLQNEKTNIAFLLELKNNEIADLNKVIERQSKCINANQIGENYRKK